MTKLDPCRSRCCTGHRRKAFSVKGALDALAQRIDHFEIAALDALVVGVLIEQFEVAFTGLERLGEYPGQTFGTGVSKVGRVSGVRAGGDVGEPA